MSADETLERLVADCGDRLLRLAHQLTHDRHLAEDVVQESLMQIYRNWRRHPPEVEHHEAYARRVVVNEFLRRRRLKSSTEVVTDLVPDTPDVDRDPLPDRQALWAALGSLNERQRTVLVLRYYEDLPDAEIADLIGAKQPTVRSLAHRGLAALRARAELIDGSHS